MSAWQRLCTGIDHQGKEMSRSGLLLQSYNDGTNLFVNISLHLQPSVQSSINFYISLSNYYIDMSLLLFLLQCIGRDLQCWECWVFTKNKILVTLFVVVTNVLHQTNILLIFQLTPQCHNSNKTLQHSHNCLELLSIALQEHYRRREGRTLRCVGTSFIGLLAI